MLLLLLIIYVDCLWQHRWAEAAILGGMMMVVFVLQFGAMFLAEVVGGWAETLAHFLFS